MTAQAKKESIWTRVKAMFAKPEETAEQRAEREKLEREDREHRAVYKRVRDVRGMVTRAEGVHKLDAVTIDSSHNGTGYMNGLLSVKLSDGIYFGADSHKREIVVHSKNGVNIIVFQRYAGQDETLPPHFQGPKDQFVLQTDNGSGEFSGKKALEVLRAMAADLGLGGTAIIAVIDSPLTMDDVISKAFAEGLANPGGMFARRPVIEPANEEPVDEEETTPLADVMEEVGAKTEGDTVTVTPVNEAEVGKTIDKANALFDELKAVADDMFASVLTVDFLRSKCGNTDYYDSLDSRKAASEFPVGVSRGVDHFGRTVFVINRGGSKKPRIIFERYTPGKGEPLMLVDQAAGGALRGQEAMEVLLEIQKAITPVAN